MALVVLLWVSLSTLMSINMTAWVGDNVACDAPAVGQGQDSAHSASPYLNWSPVLAMGGSRTGEGLPLPGAGDT